MIRLPVALTARRAAGDRIVHGLIVPWNVIGSTSAGRTLIRRGAIAVPQDSTRVKLLLEHDRTNVYGHALAFLDTPAALLSSFAVETGTVGDAILAGAAAKMRDGLSVGLDILAAERDADDVLVVTAAVLRETSSVGVPAWDDARATIAEGTPAQ